MTKTVDDLIFEDSPATKPAPEPEFQPAPVAAKTMRKTATTLDEQKSILTDPDATPEAKALAARILKCYAAGYKQYWDANSQPIVFGEPAEGYAVYWGCFSCMIELGVELDEQF